MESSFAIYENSILFTGFAATGSGGVRQQRASAAGLAAGGDPELGGGRLAGGGVEAVGGAADGERIVGETGVGVATVAIGEPAGETGEIADADRLGGNRLGPLIDDQRRPGVAIADLDRPVRGKSRALTAMLFSKQENANIAARPEALTHGGPRVRQVG
ncbi:hypothetical protein [Mycobacterium persicum]|uniref:hypothetical protein n=1 Tax=Mycobacterium persicum TaxID=1487726 RepID=UPI001F080FC4|nr:hypothetical protein [Mycobacterium persicum]